MTRPYPDIVAGPYEPPPHPFEDKEGRALTVRQYGAPDAPVDDEHEALVEMYVAFDPEDRAQGIPPVGETGVRRWLDEILTDDCFNVVAWHGDRAVGHATLVPDLGDAPDPAYELAIFVLADYQAAGIGTRLMKTLLGLGREQGVEHVWLTVERWNRPAVALYENVGFEPSETGSFELEMSATLR
ncbi:GNAT family N-acetyltransferase [Halorarius litoreus]|uniref:GNAT family N-acetyltransferase n=1 Tax=Halorarius litoreus TaxID=2962676 RepID=UPI0020CC4D4F|nr:GNAT family N-acetyltransferase [Halorarius litoreus]